MSKKFINILKTSSIAVFLFLLASPVQAAGEITIKNFSLSPTVVPNNTGNTEFQLKFGVTVDLNEFNSTCGSSSSSFYWYLYEDVTGPDTQRASGEQKFPRTSITADVNFDKSITIVTTSGSIPLTGDVIYYVNFYCTNADFGNPNLGRSTDVKIKFFVPTSDKTHACIGADNKYACSKANLTDCSDVPAGSGCPTAAKPCQKIGKNLCGEDAGTGGGKKYLCNSNNQCVENASGRYMTSNCDNECGSGGGGGTTTEFKIDNPIEADNLVQLLDVIATWLFNIAIPIMVAMIVYAGIIFLISRGDTAKVSQAKKVLLYAVVGFTIIMIGKGFITLIESILNLGKSA